MNAAALPRSLRGLLGRLRLWARAEIGEGAAALGDVWVRGEGRVRIGSGAVLDGRWAPIELHAAEGATIFVGAGARVDGGVSIEAQRRVRVGAGVHIGRLCKIMDNHFHDVGDTGRRPESSEVVIEDHAELGVRCVVLPGAVIGRGAIVRPGTVVTRRVPDGAIVGGQPAIVEARGARRAA